MLKIQKEGINYQGSWYRNDRKPDCIMGIKQLERKELLQVFRPINFIYRLAKIRHKVKSLNMYIYNHPTNQKRRTIHHSESAQ
jgi:hypothetical protein